MPDQTATATSDTARKIHLGARVVNRRDPRDAWMVEGYSIRGARMLMLSCGVMSMITPEEQWIEMPDDWVDPPRSPIGSIAYAMTVEAWAEKWARDDANEQFQCAAVEFMNAHYRWCRDHRDPLLARLAVKAKP